MTSKCCQRYLTSFDLDGPSSSTSNHRRKPPVATDDSHTHPPSEDHVKSSSENTEDTRLSSAKREILPGTGNAAQSEASDAASHTHQSSNPDSNGGPPSPSSDHVHHSSHKKNDLVFASSAQHGEGYANDGLGQGRAQSVSGQQYSSTSEDVSASRPWRVSNGYYVHHPIRLSARHRLASPSERHQVLSALIQHPLHLFSHRDRKLPFHLRNRHRVASNIQETLRALSSKRHQWTERDDVRLDFSASERTRSVVRLPAPQRAVAVGREVLARRLAHGRLPATLDTLRLFHRIQGISLSLTDGPRL